MSRSVSTVFKSAAFAQETGEALIVLVTIDHADLAAPIRVCSNSADVVSRGDTFLAFPFEITLPDDVEGQGPRASLIIDAVDQSIVQAVRSIDSAPSVLMEVVLGSDTDTIEGTWPGFQMREVAYDVLTVSGQILQEDFLMEPYPAGRITPADFPGLA